ncbi:CCHC-type zinc finger, nucleic acid binding protein a [Elysia marginata]|uniref:CCHC-type zinc finger, nucleic acid binding protein a n=1 Tax=Elysia marginata TaxID=1093978 RepID=A0AAV4F6N5_9GAST|nr:CCHC-type zinc finger, nucleic acid binding protein a [Elysia marginata]
MATTTMATATGYGPRSRLMFDGDERKYELWEIKFLGFMKIRDLDEILQNLDDEYQIDRSTPQAKKNEEVFAELVQVLDDRSLSLIIRDARNDGRAALRILREHYQPRGKPRIITLYTQLTSLTKTTSESVTDYVFRAETAAASLRDAGETISDSLLVAKVVKGLPLGFKSFIAVIT